MSMKLLKTLNLCCFLLASHQLCSATELQDNLGKSQSLITKNESGKKCPFSGKQMTAKAIHNPCGNSAFNVTDPGLWYTITTNSYPETVPLSQGRNHGAKRGALYLSPTGFTVGRDGNYWVSVTAVMQNPAEETILIPVFLVRDEIFDPEDSTSVGDVVTLVPNEVTSLHASGVVMDLKAGTRLSLVATNGGSPTPQPVNVVAWEISMFKLPD